MYKYVTLHKINKIIIFIIIFFLIYRTFLKCIFYIYKGIFYIYLEDFKLKSLYFYSYILIILKLTLSHNVPVTGGIASIASRLRVTHLRSWSDANATEDFRLLHL